MTTRTSYPPGVPSWIDLESADAPAAVDFYAGLFGWSCEDRMPAGSGAHYFIASLEGETVAAIASPTAGIEAGPRWNTYVAVADAATSAAAVRAAGGTVELEPVTIPAGTMVLCTDPTGAPFRLWQAALRAGAERVNLPGAWVFSNLVTDDGERAVEFYRQVFGWEPKAIDLGGADGTMFCLPGYGDFLASIDPDIRRRQADDHVPEDFIDIVAWLDGAPAAGADVGWRVTIGVDDADTAVERAVALGGVVVTPAYDAGPTRAAVLADLDGAQFTVSHYRPG